MRHCAITQPLLRQRPDGTWERMVIGSLADGKARYEPCVWDNAAWEYRQRESERARLLTLPRPLQEAA